MCDFHSGRFCFLHQDAQQMEYNAYCKIKGIFRVFYNFGEKNSGNSRVRLEGENRILEEPQQKPPLSHEFPMQCRLKNLSRNLVSPVTITSIGAIFSFIMILFLRYFRHWIVPFSPHFKYATFQVLEQPTTFVLCKHELCIRISTSIYLGLGMNDYWET